MLDSLKDGIGEFVCRQVERSINETEGVTVETKAYLSRCLPRLKESVETFCPAAMGGGGPELFRTAYGPLCARSDRMLAFATPKHSMIGKVDEWPSVGALGFPVDPPSFWGAIAQFIEDEDGEAALRVFVYRNKARLTEIDAKRNELIADGLTPLIIALAVEDADKACGMTMLVALPPTIEDQLGKDWGRRD